MVLNYSADHQLTSTVLQDMRQGRALDETMEDTYCRLFLATVSKACHGRAGLELAAEVSYARSAYRTNRHSVLRWNDL
jgi:hypothetical protein